MSYWYIYLLEEETGTEHTIAPGCAATAEGKSCTLTEFLRYIWAPAPGQPDDTPRPGAEVEELKSNAAWQTVDLDKVFEIIKRSPYVDGTDPGRLINGETSYWDARRKATAPIAAIEAQYPPDQTKEDNDKQYKRIRNYISQAKKAANIAYMIRLWDFEIYRVKRGKLSRNFLGGKQIRTKNLLTGINNPRSFPALDAEATLELHSDDPNFQTELINACQQYREADPDHYAALKAAQQALSNCHCETPPGDMLRR